MAGTLCSQTTTKLLADIENYRERWVQGATTPTFDLNVHVLKGSIKQGQLLEAVSDIGTRYTFTVKEICTQGRQAATLPMGTRGKVILIPTTPADDFLHRTDETFQLVTSEDLARQEN